MIRGGIPANYRCKIWTWWALLFFSDVMWCHLALQVHQISPRKGLCKFEIQISMAILYHSYRMLLYCNYLFILHTPYQVPNKYRLLLEENVSNGSYSDTDYMICHVQVGRTSVALNQIELDLLRTLPNNYHYHNPDDKGVCPTALFVFTLLPWW